VVATKDEQRIAVEVKSFVGQSTIAELEKAIGQYVLYEEALYESDTESDRQLFLAIPKDVIVELAEDKVLSILTKRLKINILVYNPTEQQIVEWTLSTTGK
jgi:hypothetical protein